MKWSRKLTYGSWVLSLHKKTWPAVSMNEASGKSAGKKSLLVGILDGILVAKAR